MNVNFGNGSLSGDIYPKGNECRMKNIILKNSECGIRNFKDIRVFLEGRFIRTVLKDRECYAY